MGYKILRVKYLAPHSFRTDELVYLLKDNIVYAPYPTKHRELIKLGYIDKIYYGDECFRIKKRVDPDEYMEMYKLSKYSTEEEKDKAFKLNVMKISPIRQVFYDKDEKGWEINIDEMPNLEIYKLVIKADNTIIDNKKSNHTYGYDATYYSITYIKKMILQ